MTHIEKLKAIDQHRNESPYAERICSELTYLDSLSALRDGAYDARIEQAADLLLSRIREDGVITAASVHTIEEFLADLGPAAKSLTELFVAHAHIDMNWQWGYNETATITVDTFRTMLTLMREYPEFTFAQSQASTYEIIEKYRPDMLPEIRQRVREGRWEVTAAEWVEPDKNMPSGESLTRQLLQAKKYLTGLLEIPAEKIRIDFVPDTFGHAITIPEILSDAGIRYMYHCRGSDGPCFYRYRAPSGKEILAYCEYGWYNKDITPACFEIVPNFCKQEKLDTFLCVYGVGDHGGGPTRLDIERILEYRSWPLTPTIRFGTYGEFFDAADRSGVSFPVLDTERNFLFSGCYTTQSRIKMANRVAEARICEAETLSAAAADLADAPRDCARFDTPWRNILFNHFHDILPGSGTIETREYAMGKFQETMAALQTSASASMNAIAACIDTTGIDFDENPNTRAEGGGVGYAVGEKNSFRLPSAERGRGNVRVLHVFNPTAYERDEVTELTVWDYPYDHTLTVLTDAAGNELPYTYLYEHQKEKGYWGHSYRVYAVRLRVPAFGYTTVVVRQRAMQGHLNPTPRTYEHTDHMEVNDAPIVMENDKIRAIFDPITGHLTHLYDRRTNEALIDKPSCFFRAIEENPVYGFIAWRIGPYMKTTDLNAAHGIRLKERTQNSLFSRFSYVLEYGRSVLNVTISLKQNSEMLEFDVTADFKEDAVIGKMIPQLAFTVPVSYATSGHSVSEIPYGTLIREDMPLDIPSHGALGICGESEHMVVLLADTKYGFRCCDGVGQITLLRNAYSPDPYSDSGIHHIRLGVAACAQAQIGEISSRLCHPLPYVSGQHHGGTLPTTSCFATLDGNARVSTVKQAEDNSGSVIRLYSISDVEEEIVLQWCRPIQRAQLTDTNENALSDLEVCKDRIRLNLAPRAMVTVKLT